VAAEGDFGRPHPTANPLTALMTESGGPGGEQMDRRSPFLSA
jgi:hypothetical protein